jgi:hypothetical protein
MRTIKPYTKKGRPFIMRYIALKTCHNINSPGTRIACPRPCSGKPDLSVLWEVILADIAEAEFIEAAVG